MNTSPNTENVIKPAPLVERFSKDFVGGFVLDIGCGSGRDAVFLAQHGFKVTAIDTKRGAIGAAQKLATVAGVSADFLVQDVRNWTFPAKHYTIIIAFNSLFFLSKNDLYAAIENIKKSLIPGGIAIIASFTVDDAMFDKVKKENTKVGERDFQSTDGYAWYFLDHGELAKAFSDFQILFHEEKTVNDPGHAGSPEPHLHAIERIVAKRAGTL